MAAILIVEDDASLLEALEFGLRTSGHEVNAFGRGMDALRFLAEGPRVDLIVIDLVMPTFSGWELLDEVRSLPPYKEVPVAIISALGPSEKASKVQAYLQKPFELAQFLEVVSRLTSPEGSALAAAVPSLPRAR